MPKIKDLRWGWWGWCLVHVVEVNRKSYVIFSGWTHSKSIKWDIDRIFVNKKWNLCVQVGSSIITVDAEPWRYWRKKFS